MAQITQKRINLGGIDIEPGTILPDDKELKGSNRHRFLDRGQIIEVPDHMIDDNYLNRPLGQDDESGVNLQATVDEVANAIEQIDDIELLDELEAREAQGKDRVTVYSAITDRKKELR